MSIRGIDRVILGVEEMDAAQQFLRDYGLNEVEQRQQWRHVRGIGRHQSRAARRQ